MPELPDVEIEVDIREIFDVLVNDEKLSHSMLDVAREVVGVQAYAARCLNRPGRGSGGRG